MKAVWKGKTVAEADKDELIYIEGNWYFPLSAVNQKYLRKSDTQYHCPWKGDAQYYDVGEGDVWSKDACFGYPDAKQSALDIVKKDFRNHVAFWQDVTVEE